MARTHGSNSEITGPRIRAAALKLFARYGYAAVSMRQIASDVGVQAGALYNYTTDKQSLLFELMRLHMEDLLKAWRQEKPHNVSPLMTMEAFTRFHIRFNTKRADAVFISYMELRNLTPANFEAIGALRRAYESEIEQILIEGMRTGDFKLSEPRIVAMAIIAMLTGVNTWYRPDGRLSLKEVELIYWSMIRPMVSERRGP